MLKLPDFQLGKTLIITIYIMQKIDTQLRERVIMDLRSFFFLSIKKMICFGDKNIATKTYMDGPNSHTLYKISFSPSQS